MAGICLFLCYNEANLWGRYAMFISYIWGPYTEKYEYVLEESKRDYNGVVKNFITDERMAFKKLIENKDIDALERVCSSVYDKYEGLENVNNLSQFEVLNLPTGLIKELEHPELEDIREYPSIIKRSDKKYNRDMRFFEKLFMRRIKNHYTEMHKLYLSDLEQWQLTTKETLEHNQNVKTKFERDLKEYEEYVVDFQNKKESRRLLLQDMHNGLKNKDIKSTQAFLEFLLSTINYPMDGFKHSVKCKIEAHTLRIEVDLPYVKDLIPYKTARYIKSRDEIRLSEYSSAELNRYYHDLIKNYIATLSGLIRENINYFKYEYFIINGKIKARNLPVKVFTISTKTNVNNLFSNDKFKSIDEWYDSTNGMVGKKLSNRTKLRGAY